MNVHQRIVHHHRLGLHNNEIARAAGTSVAYVTKVLAAEGLKRNGLKVSIETYYRKAAERRGMTVPELKNKLWKVIHEDMMIDAILDDDGEQPRQQFAEQQTGVQ